MTDTTPGDTQVVEQPADACENGTAACEQHGFTRRFEYRPDFRLGTELVDDVIDASTIRERKLDDLMVVKISDVFATASESFLGFGLPNEYLVTPDGNGGYQKFAVKSLRRAPAAVVDTRDWVQSGVWIRFKNLPAEAHEGLREAMKFYEGWKFWTCANGCMHVLERAGFASGSGSKLLTDLYMPYACFAYIIDNGLTYNGQKVEFDVIKTTPVELYNFSWQIQKATALTFCRHANRNLDTAAKKNKFIATVRNVVTAPARLFSRKTAKPKKETRVAPSLPQGVEYARDIRVRVSKPTFVGSILRLMWGSHALFEAQQTRVDPNDYFTDVLEPFPRTPSFQSKLKKWVLFRPIVIATIRHFLAPSFVDIGERSEVQIYDMMRTSTPEKPEKYNLVVTSHGLDKRGQPAGNPRIILSRLNVGGKIADWLLSKHVLMSGYDDFTVYAAEAWKELDGSIHVNLNSGTYQPTKKQREEAHAFLQAVFPHWRIVIED